MNIPGDAGSEMYADAMSVFLNHWFTAYEDARTHREAEGGYLFPFRNQFFVTAATAVAELGLDPHDPNWERIGWDWVRPRDQAAWTALRDERRQVLAHRPAVS